MPDLLVAKPDGSLLHTRPVGPRATIVLGRSPNCGVVIPSERASRHHAVIFEFAGDWYAVDLDSTAGIQIEAGPVRLHRFSEAAPWVRLGPVVVWIDGLDADARTDASRPTPIRLKSEPAVRTREDFVTPPPPPPPTDGSSLLVAFRRRSDDAMRLLDLAGADRVLIGGDPRADIVVPDDDAVPMRSLFFRVGQKWAGVDLTETTSAGDEPGHRRLSPGRRLELGPVQATVLDAEPVIQHAEDASEDEGFDPFEVPDLGSIFATKPGASDGESPSTPQKH